MTLLSCGNIVLSIVAVLALIGSSSYAMWKYPGEGCVLSGAFIVFTLGVLLSSVSLMALNSAGLARADLMINANTENTVDLTQILNYTTIFGLIIITASFAGCRGALRRNRYLLCIYTLIAILFSVLFIGFSISVLGFLEESGPQIKRQVKEICSDQNYPVLYKALKCTHDKSDGDVPHITAGVDTKPATCNTMCQERQALLERMGGCSTFQYICATRSFGLLDTNGIIWAKSDSGVASGECRLQVDDDSSMASSIPSATKVAASNTAMAISNAAISNPVTSLNNAISSKVQSRRLLAEYEIGVLHELKSPIPVKGEKRSEISNLLLLPKSQRLLQGTTSSPIFIAPPMTYLSDPVATITNQECRHFCDSDLDCTGYNFIRSKTVSFPSISQCEIISPNKPVTGKWITKHRDAVNADNNVGSNAVSNVDNIRYGPLVMAVPNLNTIDIATTECFVKQSARVVTRLVDFAELIGTAVLFLGIFLTVSILCGMSLMYRNRKRGNNAAVGMVCGLLCGLLCGLCNGWKSSENESEEASEELMAAIM